jgi:hypothetical protein
MKKISKNKLAVLGEGITLPGCEMDVEDDQSPCLISSQRSNLPAVILLHLNDKCICQWEICSKFKVLNLAPILTLYMRGSAGSSHFSFTCWQVQPSFGTASQNSFLKTPLPVTSTTSK